MKEKEIVNLLLKRSQDCFDFENNIQINMKTKFQRKMKRI